jgi:hypothetical protein
MNVTSEVTCHTKAKRGGAKRASKKKAQTKVNGHGQKSLHVLGGLIFLRLSLFSMWGWEDP